MDSGYLRELLDDAERDIESLTKERDEWKRRAERASVLATKHCPRDHHDWQEICTTVNHWFEREE